MLFSRWRFLSRFAILFFIVALAPSVYAGGDDDDDGPPTLPEEADCKDYSFMLNDKKWYNPLKAELRKAARRNEFSRNRIYRPSTMGDKALNYQWYAVQEGQERTDSNGKKYGVFPVYAWVKKFNGFQCVASHVEQVNFFDPCGCYVGSICNPVTFYEETYEYVLTKRWVTWSKFCHRMDYNPPLQQAILHDLKRHDTFGWLTLKGMPRGLNFIERFREFAIEPDEDEKIFNPDGTLVRKKMTLAAGKSDTGPKPGAATDQPVDMRKDGGPTGGLEGFIPKVPNDGPDLPPATAQEVRNDGVPNASLKTDDRVADRVPGKAAVYSPYDDPNKPRREIEAVNPITGAPLPAGTRMKDPFHDKKWLIVPKLD